MTGKLVRFVARVSPSDDPRVIYLNEANVACLESVTRGTKTWVTLGGLPTAEDAAWLIDEPIEVVAARLNGENDHGGVS